MKRISLVTGLSSVIFLFGSTYLLAAPPAIKKGTVLKPSHTHASLQQKIKKDSKGHEYVEGEVIVKYKNQVQKNRALDVVGSFNVSEIHEFKVLSKSLKKSMMLIRSKTLSTEELIEEYRNDPDVEYVEPNHIHYPFKTPNDPKYNLLWGQHNTGQTVNGATGTPDKDIDAPEAWNKGTGSNSVVIAVIDTGVDYLHEDLAANMWVNTGEIAGNGLDDDNNGYIDDIHGINSINDSGDPMDIIAEEGGHGTHVAGTIAAVGNNGKGVVGVSWNAKIMALKFLGTNGSETSMAIKCLEYMIEQKSAGVNIAASNNSWGGGGFEQSLKDAIEATTNAGVLFLAAAGNGGDDGVGDDNDADPSYPSSYDLSGIIAVAATDQNDALASFSNYGVTSVDLSAPGTNIYSTVPRAYQPSVGDIFFDDFESGDSGWIKEGTSDWGITDDLEYTPNPDYPVPSPTHFLSDSPGVDYAPNTDSRVYRCMDLSNVTDDVYLGFGADTAIENYYDHGYTEVTGNGTDWTQLADFSGYFSYWTNPYTFKIPDFVKTSNFCFGFRLTSDESVQDAGWLIDDVGVGTNLTHAYGYKDGTSMATPQVAGAVALIASICGNETVQERKNRIMNSVDQVAALNGKVITGGRLNVNNAIQNCSETPSSFSMAPIYYLLFD